MTELQSPEASAQYTPIETRFEQAFERRKDAAIGLAEARRKGDGARRAEYLDQFQRAQRGNQRRAHRRGRAVREDARGRKVSTTRITFSCLS